MKNSVFIFSFGVFIFFSLLVQAQPTTKMGGSNASRAAKINGTSVVTGQPTISSAFSPKTFQWDIAWPGRESQYDLVYKSPPIEPMQCIPLDNGDLPILPICRNGKKSKDWLLQGNPSTSEGEYKDGREVMQFLTI